MAPQEGWEPLLGVNPDTPHSGGGGVDCPEEGRVVVDKLSPPGGAPPKVLDQPEQICELVMNCLVQGEPVGWAR